MAIQSDGKILVAGSTGDDYLVLRFHSDGSPDISFDMDGAATAHFGGVGYEETATAIALQPDGRIVLAGHYRAFDRTLARDTGVVRFNMNGSIDATFGRSGCVAFGTDMDGKWTDELQAVAIQPDGKIIVAGRTNRDGQYNFLVHPTKAYFDSWIPRILSLKNS